LAVASAFIDPFMPMGSQMEEEAMSCPTNTCLTTQAQDCQSTSSDSKTCIYGEFKNTSFVGSTVSCNCRTVAQWPALGTTCSAGSTQTNQCGPYATCAVMTGGGAADWKCYGKKMIGDSCTVGGYECAAPRVCTSGVCSATLAAGATCYNATTTKSLGVCPLTQYCPTVYTADQVCTAYLAAGVSCSSGGKCVPYTICGLTSVATAPTCDRWVFGTIAAGTDYNLALEELSCTSFTANYTSKKCVDYDTELAKWNTAFPSPSTMSTCTVDEDCNLVGVYLASCVCTNKATGATPYCLLSQKGSISNANRVAVLKQDGIMETGYNAGCENPTPNGAEFVNNAAYCSSKWSSTFLASVCPTVSFGSNFFSCYDTTLGLCNGASALQSSVVMTMIVALVAFFTTQ